MHAEVRPLLTRLLQSSRQIHQRRIAGRSCSTKTKAGPARAGALLHLPRTLQERRVLKVAPPRKVDRLDRVRAEPLTQRQTGGRRRTADLIGKWETISAVYPRSKSDWY